MARGGGGVGERGGRPRDPRCTPKNEQGRNSKHGQKKRPQNAGVPGRVKEKDTGDEDGLRRPTKKKKKKKVT